MKLEKIEEPTVLPVPLQSIKEYLKVLDDEQDEQIELMAWSYLQHAENITNLTLKGVTTYKVTLNSLRKLSFPKNPLISVEKVEYQDIGGDLQLLNEGKYNVDNTTVPGTIEFLQVPPSTHVEVTFKAGYETLPKEVELWLKVKVLEEFDKTPEAECSKHIDSMLNSLRIIPV